MLLHEVQLSLVFLVQGLDTLLTRLVGLIYLLQIALLVLNETLNLAVLLSDRVADSLVLFL